MIPHLRFHSEYSFTHGLIRLSGEREIGKLAAERGIAAVALTDSNNVCGAIPHYKSCLRHGVKPILGCHARFRRGEETFSSTLLCMDEGGFRSLSKLLTKAQLEGDGSVDADRVSAAEVEGLTMLTGYGGDVSGAIMMDRKQRAQELIRFWQGLFPDGRLACELSFCGREGEDGASRMLAALAMEEKVPCAAAHPALFADPDDYGAHEVRHCIANALKLDDPNRARPYSRGQHLPDAAEMEQTFGKWPEALENAAEIARRCNYDFGLQGKPQFPKLPGVDSDKADARLRELAEKGLEGKLPQGADDAARDGYASRLAHEIEVITGKGFSDYFLIVADLVGHARESGIPVGPGRGSGAGSLVAYSLGITDVDPIEHGLLFERFLNPERTAMPDFDIDFCKDRREQVIGHARKLYGEDCVSQVITFGSLKAKAVVRDVCRVLDMPYSTGDTISRLIPDQLNITLGEAREDVEELDKMIEGDEDIDRLWQFSRQLEGLPRQGSTHAAAMLIAPRPLVEFCPLIKVGDREKAHAVSQYDMGSVEAVGLLKFDILGLKNLTMIDTAERMIREREPGFSMAKADLSDDALFDLYRNGRTVGVFQCESQGMVKLIRDIGPRSIEDIAVSISLYRPGALNTGMDEMYLKNRDDQSRVTYPHPSVREILEPTYGAMIYQEQPMRISQELAGFTLARADVMRAAMGKKDPEKMAELEEDFVSGCVDGGKLPAGEAKALFEKIKEFAGYGFNKSHAIAYAKISLQTAFLKARHTAEFFASSLATWNDDPKTQRMLLRDAEASGVRVLPPDINKSGVHYEPVTGESYTIRFGLGSVRAVGVGCAEDIVADRQREGDYGNMDELCRRVPSLSKKGLENLVFAGAVDGMLGEGDSPCAMRAALRGEVEGAFETAAHANQNANQENLFGAAAPPAPRRSSANGNDPWTMRKLLINEMESLGTTISGKFTDSLSILSNGNGGFRKLSDLESGGEGSWAGTVTRVLTSSRMRKTGRDVFLLDDGELEREVQTRSENIAAPSLSEPGQVLVVSGKADPPSDRFNARISANKVMTLDQWLSERVRSVAIRVPGNGRGPSEAELDWLLSALRGSKKGRAKVYFNVDEDKASVPVDTNMTLELDSELLETIRDRFGQDALKIRIG